MNNNTIREIALLTAILPQQWDKSSICHYFGISPARFDKLKESSTWQEMDKISQKFLLEKRIAADKKWEDDLLNEIQDYQDNRLKIGRIQQASCLILHRLLNKRIKILDEADQDTFADHFDSACTPIASMLKALASLDNQADKNIYEGMSIGDLIKFMQDMKKEESPRQLDLYLA